MNPLSEVITLAEAVKYSGFNVRKVRCYCKSGKFDARQDYKGKWLILKSSIIKHCDGSLFVGYRVSPHSKIHVIQFDNEEEKKIWCNPERLKKLLVEIVYSI